jgi:hypothetical protein
MSEKASSEIENVTHAENNEKIATETHQPDLAEEGGRRRKSVALNIIENPLKVSFATSNSSPFPKVISDIMSIGTDSLHLNRTVPRKRQSLMRKLLLSCMAWASTPTCSVVLLS